MQEYTMKALRSIFSAIHLVGSAGIGVLFIYIEWTYLRQDFSDLFNPSMHLVVLWKMLTHLLFWILLAIAIAGYFGKVRLDLWIGKRLREEWGKSEEHKS